MSVKRNTLINTAGAIAPIAVSLVTVPLYLHRIGDARYGVLAIVWLLVAYFGVFDLGLSRATANQIAKLQNASASERERVFWNALALNAFFGLVGGIVLYAVAGLLFATLFKVPVLIKPELAPTLPWIALAIPVATISGVLTGTLEGRSRFATVNAIQVGGTILSQLVPLSVALLRGPSLTWLVPSAVLARLVSSVPLAWVTARAVPISRPQWPSRGTIRTLLGYGAWVAVTNLINPILDFADRLVIGATIGAKSVTYYTIPYSLATRVNILPGALSRTLFPVLSYKSDLDGLRLATQAVRGLAAILTPIVIFGIVLMRPFLTIWVGADAANRSFGVGEIMLAGTWLSSLSFIPFAQLQGQSHPEVVARFHLLEAIPFLALLWVGLHIFGIAGAAGAWSVRISADAVLLFFAAGYGFRLVRSLAPAFSLIVAACAVAIIFPFPSILGWAAGGLLFALSLFWAFSFDSPARAQFADLWRSVRQVVGRR